MATSFHCKTKYLDEQACVLQGQYANGETALTLQSVEGEPLTVATVCLVDYGHKPEEGNVFIYGDYSEHVGIQAALEKAGIVSTPIRTITYGPYDAHAFESKLLI